MLFFFLLFMGSPGSEIEPISPELVEGSGNPLWYSCLENPVDRGAWTAAHRVAESWTWLKRLSVHACIREGNGNPLQYSCLVSPRDGGAWWAAVYGVAQSWTRLKWLSSSPRFGRWTLHYWTRRRPHRCFILFVAVIFGIVSLISLCDLSLLVYWNARISVH